MRKESLFAVIVCLMMLGASVAELPKYEIIDLDAAGESRTIPYAINDAGQIVGQSTPIVGYYDPYASWDDHMHPDGRLRPMYGESFGFIWDRENGLVNMSELANESVGWNSIDVAIDINNNGQVIGLAPKSGVIKSPFDPVTPVSFNKRVNSTIENPLIRDFVFSGDIRLPGIGLLGFETFVCFQWDTENGFTELTDYGQTGPLSVLPYPIKSINDNGQILGVTLWDEIRGGIESKDDIFNFSANDINNSGFVVGRSYTTEVNFIGQFLKHAFIWDSQNGTVDITADLKLNSGAWSINNNNMVVGAYQIPIGESGELAQLFSEEKDHAFVWTSEEGMIDIHDSHYLNSLAVKNNDMDEVVGILSRYMISSYLGTPRTPWHLNTNYYRDAAFIWNEDIGMVELIELLPEGSGWAYLEKAVDINNRGQIVGYGITDEGVRHGFLMTPPANHLLLMKLEKALEKKRQAIANINIALECDDALIGDFVGVIRGRQRGRDGRSRGISAISSLVHSRRNARRALEALEESVGQLEDARQQLGIELPDNNQYRPPARDQMHYNKMVSLILTSNRAIGRIEKFVLELYDLACAAATGSYSDDQRASMNIEFQRKLAMLDPLIERVSVGRRNMLNVSGETVTVHTHGETLEFDCVDLTMAGLSLDGDFSLSTHNEAAVCAMSLRLAVRRIIEVKLQFADYVTELSNYFPNVKPMHDVEVKFALEIIEVSKQRADLLAAAMYRALELAEQSAYGSYSNDQRVIMDAEFGEQLDECSRLAVKAYYGMGIIDSTDVLSVDTGRGVLEFAGFDLTTAGLGVDGDLSIRTPADATDAYPYIEAALQSAQDAVAGLNDYIQTLSAYIQKPGRSSRLERIKPIRSTEPSKFK